MHLRRLFLGLFGKLILLLGFMLAFLLSLVLVAVNIGQIITILVPLINSHASPDHNYRRADVNRRMKCGFGAEVTAVSATLSISV